MTKPDLLLAIERRRDAGEDPCESCNAAGRDETGGVCMHCLGQKVLLTAEEFEYLLVAAGHITDDDSILDSAILFEKE